MVRACAGQGGNAGLEGRPVIDAPPSTTTAPVRAVATVVRLLGTFTWPAADGQPVPAAISRERIHAIDFYPANPANHQGEPSAL